MTSLTGVKQLSEEYVVGLKGAPSSAHLAPNTPTPRPDKKITGMLESDKLLTQGAINGLDVLARMASVSHITMAIYSRSSSTLDTNPVHAHLIGFFLLMSMPILTSIVPE